jgi:tetratricopeptide (TPR) repeat protein
VLPAEFQSALVENAGGNPLYAEEFARMLEEREEAGTLGELELPATVQGIIAARLDGLVPEEKALLQDASVIGKVFWLGSLAAIGGVGEPELERSLHGLERRELVRRERQAAVAGERQYAFRHLLVREVAYGQIPRASRAEKHRLAGEWIESLAPDRTEDRAEMLAHHYGAAVEYARAAGQDAAAIAERAGAACVEAADRALGLNAFQAAADFYGRALELWPQGSEPPAQLRLRRAQALHAVGDEQAEPALVDARDALLAAGASAEAALAESLISHIWWHRGHQARSRELVNRAVELVEDAPDSAAKARVLTMAASSFMVALENDEAIRLGREALAIAEALDLGDIQAHALDNIGSARVNSGDMAGVDDLERSIDIADSVNSPEAARGYTNIAAICVGRGELTRARELYHEARRVSERFGNPGNLRFVLGFEPFLDYCFGDFDAAGRKADAIIAEHESGSPHILTSLTFVIRGLIRVARGQIDDAAADARQAIEVGGAALAQRGGDVGWAAGVLTESGNVEEARRVAIELIEARRANVRTLQVLVGLAVVAERLGVASDLRELLELDEAGSRWVAGARAILAGDDLDAAEIFAAIPSLPDEAAARVRAARRLLDEGREPEANEQLERALAFWRAVGATRYVAEAEALRAQAETA